MSIAEAQYAVDEVNGLLKDMSYTQQVGSNVSKQVLISSLTQKASSSGYQIQVRSFVAEISGSARLTATLYGYSSGAVSQLAVNTSPGLSLSQDNMRTNANTVAYVTVTGNASKTVSIDFEIESGKTYYLYLGSVSSGSSAYAYCTSAYLGWEDKRFVNTESARRCGIIAGYITTSSGKDTMLSLQGVGHARVFFYGRQGSGGTLAILVDGAMYSVAAGYNVSVGQFTMGTSTEGLASNLGLTTTSSSQTKFNIRPYVDLYFYEGLDVFISSGNGGYRIEYDYEAA